MDINGEKVMGNIHYVNAKFTKIDFVNSVYIYYFTTEKWDGVFANRDGCYSNIGDKIKINENYLLILRQEEIDNLRGSSVDDLETTVTLNNIHVWDSGMKSKYFIECINVCGNKIYQFPR